MAILLGHTTALEYWRSLATTSDLLLHESLLGSSVDRRNVTKSLQQQLRSARSRRESLDYLLENPDSHVITLGRRIQSRHRLAVQHNFSRLPAYSCVRANAHFHGEVLYVSTPEYCFLQMATLLTLEELIALGFELCGTYAIQGDRTVFDAHPLSSPERIDALLARSAGLRGVKKARRAMRYVLAGSASPMETALTMFFTLPYSLGGYGLKRPKLNHRIDIPLKLKSKVESAYYVCDLFWERAKLAIEYDSNLAHAGVNKTVRDAMRRSVLTALGISVLSVTWPQVKNAEALNQLAHLVAEKTHKRLQYAKSNFRLRHHILRRRLLFSS